SKGQVEKLMMSAELRSEPLFGSISLVETDWVVVEHVGCAIRTGRASPLTLRSLDAIPAIGTQLFHLEAARVGERSWVEPYIPEPALSKVAFDHIVGHR